MKKVFYDVENDEFLIKKNHEFLRKKNGVNFTKNNDFLPFFP